MAEERNDAGGGPLRGVSQTDAMFKVLRESVDNNVVTLIEHLVRDAPDHKLSRINVLDFASSTGLDEECTIAAFLHATRIGIFDFSWNILCPGCGSLLDAATTLKNIRREKYECSLCVAANEVTLDEMVEVSFAVAPRVRQDSCPRARNTTYLGVLSTNSLEFSGRSSRQLQTIDGGGNP